MICANFMEHPLTFYLAEFTQCSHEILTAWSVKMAFSFFLIGFDRAMSTWGLNCKMPWHCSKIFYSNFTVSLCDYFRTAFNHDWNELWPSVHWVIQTVRMCSSKESVVRNFFLHSNVKIKNWPFKQVKKRNCNYNIPFKNPTKIYILFLII